MSHICRFGFGFCRFGCKAAVKEFKSCFLSLEVLFSLVVCDHFLFLNIVDALNQMVDHRDKFFNSLAFLGERFLLEGGKDDVD